MRWQVSDEEVERRGRTKLAGRENDEGWQDRDTSYFDTLTVADVLDDDRQNPLIYHASKPYVEEARRTG